jgi:hypothetical protein
MPFAARDRRITMKLLKPLRRRKTKESVSAPLFLVSDHAPCTCPEPCERDHGNE